MAFKEEEAIFEKGGHSGEEGLSKKRRKREVKLCLDCERIGEPFGV